MHTLRYLITALTYDITSHSWKTAVGKNCLQTSVETHQREWQKVPMQFLLTQCTYH